MSRPTPLSGFPEWLPEQRIVEQSLIDQLRRTFELHGFSGIETRSVEPVDVLLRKGEIDKEVYAVRRIHAEESEAAELALHYDLTVPFARYVLENAGKLNFPFKRYQIQKCWRGERPQVGRYREFVQADIDIVNVDDLPFHYDVEVALTAADVLASLPIPAVRIRTNNRKICEGFYLGIGLQDIPAALRAVDKRDKIGPEAVERLLVETAGADQAQARQCLALAAISTEDESFLEQVHALGVSSQLLEEGLRELATVVGVAREQSPGIVVADLSIARGLDYYTGTVYEIAMDGVEGMSVGAGGRYDNLASSGKVRYPGVGISLGISRLLGLQFADNRLRASRSVPTCVLVAVSDEADRRTSERAARALRERGIPTEVSPNAAKFGKQIRYADRRGIPFVWFAGTDGDPDEVKDIRSGDQSAADAHTWEPPRVDLWPSIVTDQA